MTKQEKPRYIAWRGGKCPVDPDTRVDVIFRCLNMDNDNDQHDAGRWIWEHKSYGDDYDIIAYRILD